MLLVAILVVLGIGLLLLEILVIPGTTIFGLIGFGVMAYGVYRSYIDVGTTEGHITLGAALLGLIAALFFGLRPKMWKPLTMGDTLDAKVNEFDESFFVEGLQGKALSALRPSGNALFGEKVMEVQTLGEIIPAGTDIQIRKIENQKIFVKSIDSNN